MTTSSDQPIAERPAEAGSTGSTSESGAWRLSGCELLDSVAAELAVGSLTGAERSAALAHLDGCQSCRRLVEDLTSAADSLLLIAAEADSPAGFEVRLLDRLKAAGGSAAGSADPGTSLPPLPRRWPAVPVARRGDGEGESVSSANGGGKGLAHRLTARARVMLAAAAVALAAAGIGLGFEVAPRIAPAVSAAGLLRFSPLRAPGGATGSRGPGAGEVVITTGPQAWLLMTVHVHATGWVTCEVGVNGQEVPVGRFELYEGRGNWAAPLYHAGTGITSARVVGASGRVLASADLQA